jgi:hypothetical protein
MWEDVPFTMLRAKELELASNLRSKNPLNPAVWQTISLRVGMRVERSTLLLQ